MERGQLINNLQRFGTQLFYIAKGVIGNIRMLYSYLNLAVENVWKNMKKNYDLRNNSRSGWKCIDSGKDSSANSCRDKSLANLLIFN